jgi:hypothetical protein
LRRPSAYGRLITAKHQDEGQPDVGEREDCAIGDAFPQFRPLAEMIGHEHRLAMPRHGRVDRAEQYGRRHRGKDGPSITPGDVAKAARHAA